MRTEPDGGILECQVRVTGEGLTFQEYLVNRGYDLQSGTAAFLWRMFHSVWAQPGFHRFWRVWNPVYGYVLFRLYPTLGGRRRLVLATMTVFLFCGFVLHDLPVSIIRGHLQVTVTAAFFLYGVLTLLFRWAGRRLSFLQWPAALQVICNIGCVSVGLLFGAWVQNGFLMIL